MKHLDPAFPEARCLCMFLLHKPINFLIGLSHYHEFPSHVTKRLQNKTGTEVEGQENWRGKTLESKVPSVKSWLHYLTPVTSSISLCFSDPLSLCKMEIIPILWGLPLW